MLLKTILFILFTMLIGRELNKILASYGIISPDYLPTMILAIFFVTIGNRFTESFIDHTKIYLPLSPLRGHFSLGLLALLPFLLGPVIVVVLAVLL